VALENGPQFPQDRDILDRIKGPQIAQNLWTGKVCPAHLFLSLRFAGDCMGRQRGASRLEPICNSNQQVRPQTGAGSKRRSKAQQPALLVPVKWETGYPQQAARRQRWWLHAVENGSDDARRQIG